MSLLRRYSTALSRHHRSAGFGIHSPFAFEFVTGVLCQRLPYYGYAALGALRRDVIACQRSHWPHTRIISLKNAKLLFRLANFFGPAAMLQIGTDYGIASAALLTPDSRSRLVLYEPDGECLDASRCVLAPYSPRVDLCASLAEALERYNRLHPDAAPFVLISNIGSDADAAALADWLNGTLGSQATVVCRNLQRCPRIAAAWQHICDRMTFGQTFTNHKIAVAVNSPRLQREHFDLWF